MLLQGLLAALAAPSRLRYASLRCDFEPFGRVSASADCAATTVYGTRARALAKTKGKDRRKHKSKCKCRSKRSNNNNNSNCCNLQHFLYGGSDELPVLLLSPLLLLAACCCCLASRRLRIIARFCLSLSACVFIVVVVAGVES